MMVDLLMWTFNGERTLPLVLRRINEVVPSKNVHARFIVDDNSSDKTRAIAEEWGWKVYMNKGKGISDGANTALSLVESDYFCSFEQDLLLNPEWWKRIAHVILQEDVAAVSGIRHQYPSVCMRKLHEYTAERYMKWRSGLPPYLNTKGRLLCASMWGRTFDNTIFKTDVVRSVGGFPKLKTNGGVDTVLTNLIVKAGYEWPVDFSVVSLHLNKTFRNELHCQYLYGSCYDEIARCVPELPVNLLAQTIRLFYSPLASIHPVIVKRCPSIIVAYPLLRFHSLKGILDSRKGKRWVHK